MHTVDVLGFDPAIADPLGFSLLWIPILFHVAILILPGAIAYFTWQLAREPRIVQEIRTSEFDLTPGERAFIEKEHEEQERRKAA